MTGSQQQGGEPRKWSHPHKQTVVRLIQTRRTGAARERGVCACSRAVGQRLVSPAGAPPSWVVADGYRVVRAELGHLLRLRRVSRCSPRPRRAEPARGVTPDGGKLVRRSPPSAVTRRCRPVRRSGGGPDDQSAPALGRTTSAHPNLDRGEAGAAGEDKAVEGCLPVPVPVEHARFPTVGGKTGGRDGAKPPMPATDDALLLALASASRSIQSLR